MDEVQPLTEPAVMPETIWRWKNMKRISGGMVTSRMSMNSRLYAVLYWLWKLKSVSWTVAFSSPGQEVQGVGEVVPDEDRLDDDDRDHHRLEQREDDPEEQVAAGPLRR